MDDNEGNQLLFASSNLRKSDFISMKFTNLETSVTDSAGTSRTLLVLNYLSLEFSEFAGVLDVPAWKIFRGNMLLFPNKYVFASILSM